MFAQLVQFFTPSQAKHDAAVRYAALVQKARNPIFYTEYGVADTLDGRFEMILVQMMFELKAIRADDIDGALRQALAEAFFDDMDRSLREIGVSDTGVGKRVKRMVEAFYGRIDAYEKAIEVKNDTALIEALKRNVYASDDTEPSEQAVAHLADYITSTYQAA